MSRAVRGLLFSVAVALGTVPPAAAQTPMKLASATINDVQHEWLKRFQADLEKRVAGKLKIEIYPASQLGAIPRMVEGVLTGTIEAFVTPTSFLVGTDPRFQIFDAIGVFNSPEHLDKVLTDPVFRRRALSLGEQRGLKGLAIFYNSPIVVLSRQPIKALDDFKGQKIRVFASPMQIEPVKALGGTAVPLALNEVLPALQSGSIDGLLAGIPVLSAMKFYDAAKSVTEIHPSIVISTLVVNKKWHDSQPADVQVSMSQAANKVDSEMFPVASGIVERASKVWSENGGALIKLSQEDQSKMMNDLKTLGTKILSANAAVKSEYEELLKVVERYSK